MAQKEKKNYNKIKSVCTYKIKFTENAQKQDTSNIQHFVLTSH